MAVTSRSSRRRPTDEVPAGATEPALPWRARILPRSALGLASLLLAAAIGAAFSGTIFFAYYSYQINKLNQKVDTFVGGFDQQFKNATGTINADATNGKAAIQKALEPLLKIQQGGTQLQGILSRASPAVWFVHTLDDAGQPAVGSGFVVATDNNQSLIVTSYATVAAATHTPAPAIFVRKNGGDVRAQLWTWDPAHDLALLIINQPNLPKLNFAPQSPGMHVGDEIYAISGLGSGSGAITQGAVAGVAGNVIQDNVAVGSAGQGGPILDSSGDVVGVASLTYAPLGFPSTGVYFTVPITAACSHILRCPGGNIGGVGSQGGAGT